ncbi:hypothetical protein VPNG_02194 [Cytospora leucostoma]|uniref:F-box domain-containing protein n=1 Tax=Cytospora leucostoma TaxID=1230097 RepID=A0A423XHA3_9PEZI|nr:hypothetical protein VPNG_02194 [Cytospora leucostoma]
MARLTDLPTEILLPILEHLSLVSIPTFLTSQATCRIFRSIVRDIIARPPAPIWTHLLPDDDEEIDEDYYEEFLSPLAHPFLLMRFITLFQSSSSFTQEERRAISWFLTLDGDVTRPFRRLPWARGARSREKYLRGGASWRGLSVTFHLGLPVTRVEIIKSYSSEDFNEDGRDHVQYLQVDDMPAPGFLTMGLLYDLLLCGGAVGDDDAATFGGETGSWELVVGARLRDYDLLLEYECFILDDEDLVDTGPSAAQSAILYVRGGTVDGHDQDRRFGELEDDEVEWVPELLGPRPTIRPAV